MHWSAIRLIATERLKRVILQEQFCTMNSCKPRYPFFMFKIFFFYNLKISYEFKYMNGVLGFWGFGELRQLCENLVNFGPKSTEK